MDADKLAVTPEDEALASRFWRIHPDELVEMGTYREEFYAREIAKHRIASEQAAARRALEMEKVLRGFVSDLTGGGSNSPNMLSISHDALSARVKQAHTILAIHPKGPSHE